MGQFNDLTGFTLKTIQAQHDGPNPTGTVTDYYAEFHITALLYRGCPRLV
jgi:hypothetical protein